MEIELQISENLKDDTDCENRLEQKFPSPSDSDVKNNVSGEVQKEDKCNPEKEKVPANHTEDDCQISKNLNVREIHETSPFKQAIKGFVLNKLSKKVGSSHVLSGITEKIVKKLEDKDTFQPASVHSSESDLSISSGKVSEISAEAISSSLSCELKSVVANDLIIPEINSIESAIECTEESKSEIDFMDIGINIPDKIKFHSSSISLPSSPAHGYISKRASSISYSLENVDLTRKNMHSPNLTFLCEDNKTNNPESKSEEEIELEDIKPKNTSSIHRRCSSEIIYPCNVYSCEQEIEPKFKRIILMRIFSLFTAFKNILMSLTLSHFFLLASIIIHNINFISSFLVFVFDGIIIAYVCYSYICNLVQKPIPNKTSDFPFLDPQLENASIRVLKTSKIVKGSVKVLRGEYDPAMVTNQSTDLMDIIIENCCLKICAAKKKSKEAYVNSESYASYDLVGATVSIVPKDLSRRGIWKRKYPICITLLVPPTQKTTPDDDSNDSDSLSVDYLCVVKQENNIPTKKGLYLFALTDREKETLFWALKRNTVESDNKEKDSEQTCDTSSKIDFSSMSYTSLMELSNEESFSESKDTFEEESLPIADKSREELNFKSYMKTLFENFERMNKFTPRSRSFEDLSNLKEDISKSSEFLSKDDSFLFPNSKEYAVDWLNVALGRVFYDFLTQKYWNDDLKDRIQKKLNKIEMPSFIESLEVSDVFLGSSLPQIHTVSNPVADNNGVWFHFDFNYCGSFQMTLKTKLNISKAKHLPDTETPEATEGKQNVAGQLSESSDDEGNETKKASSSKSKKFIDRIEKWISHKHFQTVAQSRFVKRYVGDLSNMPLTLTVELNILHGTLMINIPPSPTDRIWYGFRKDPVLSLNASPKVGTRDINLSAVVQMIERKLIQEFKKAVVMPNMDDLLIPVMYTPIYEL